MSLPVQLTSFEANINLNELHISWSTSSEINNDYFQVERSVDGINFNSIVVIDGFGTTNSPQRYQHIDYTPLPGLSYYRLRQVDFDGQFEILEPVSVYHDTQMKIGIFPNPIKNNTAQLFMIDNSENEVVHIKLYD